MKTFNKIFALLSLVTIIGITNVYAQCTASFTSVDNGNGNYTFTNTSTGNNSLIWSLGNGQWAYSPVVNHTYTSNGTFNITLITHDTLSFCADTAYQSITITSIPPCTVTAGFTYIDNGNGNVSFTNTSTSSNFTYWSFGDGSGSSLTNPNHTYTSNGTYNVYLEVLDSTGNCSDTVYQTITITSIPPCTTTAGFIYIDNGNGNYTFTNTSTGSNWSNWTFGNGGSNSNFTTVTNTYSTNGTYTAYLIVGDSNTGCTDTNYQVITVTSVPPCNIIVDFTSVDNGNGNYSFTPNIIGGTAPYAYNWWFSGTGSALTNPSHTFTNGQHNPSLSITDANGCTAWYGDTIIVNNCNYTVTTHDTIGTQVDFYVNLPFGSTYFWNFGDGATSTTSGYGWESHTYPSAGTYYYCVTVDNCPTICDSLIVVGTPCNVTANFTYVDNGNLNYTFTNNSSPNSTSYYWFFGDGQASSSANPNHTYLTVGNYTASLYSTDIQGCTNTYYDTITVTSAPPCNITAEFTYINNGNGNYSFTPNIIGGTAPYAYNWWFSGTGSTLTNPSHTFTNGQHNPTLSITDANGCTAWYGDTIIVNNCNYTVTTYDTTGTQVDFYVNLPFGSTYFWDFGDGATSTTSGYGWESHTYPSAGTYYYCVTVDNCPTICDSVIVVAPPCNITSNFTYTDNGNGDYSFTNTSTGSFDNYYWSFGDGNSSTLPNPTHTFLSNGTFITQLIVSDSIGFCSDLTNITIQVSGVANPVTCNAAFIITPDSNNVGNVIVYNTSTGNNLSYVWTFGDGNASTQQFPNHTYTGSGPYNLCLTVTDSLNGGTCSSTYCDSINSGGLVFKGGGFSLSVVAPTVTNIENTTNQISSLSIYPNPFKNNLNIELNIIDNTNLNIFVTDILGNRVSDINTKNATLGENRFTWNSTNFSNGIYLLNIKTNNTLKVEKLILNR